MSQEKITKRIDGIDFVIRRIPGRVALRLDKQVIQLVLPAVKGLKSLSGVDLDSEISDFDFQALGPILDIVSESLSSLPEEEYVYFFTRLFETVQAKAPGKPAIQMDSEESFDIFDNMLTIYKLALAVMRFNKFSVFGVVAGGFETPPIITSEEETAANKNHSGKSEESGSLRID